MPHATVEEKIIAGTFLCEQSANEFLAFHKPGWNEIITKPLEEKKVLNEIIAIYLEFINENLEITNSCIKAGSSFKEKTKVFQKKIFSYELNNSKFHSMLFKHFRN